MIKIHKSKKMVFIGGPQDHPESQERLRAFKQACEENDILVPEDYILFSDWSKISIPPLLEGWLENHALPDTFIFANDIMAMSGCDYLRGKGFSVPKDVLVTGFDCINEAQFYNPPVTSVNHEWHSMGVTAFKQLYNLMHNLEIEPLTIQKTKFVPGGTCGCPVNPLHNHANKEFLHRTLSEHQMDPLLIDSHFRHFYNAVRKAVSNDDLYYGFSYLFSHEHTIEGNDFELYLDPEFFRIVDDNSNLHTTGHPDYYDRICSIKNSEIRPLESVAKKDAIFSAASKCDKANYFIFVPLYSEMYTFGFAVLNGALNAANENQYYIWTRHMIQALEQVRSNITISKLYDQMRVLSETDSLTGAYNRTGCQAKAYPQMIAHTKRGGTSVVMLVDVDRMKTINDQFGHAAGDQALIAITNVIKDNLSETFAITRFGGDEFLITGCLYDAIQNMDAVVDNIQLSLSEYTEKSGIEFPLSVSIGYAKITPNDVSDIEKGIVLSDENMYQMKKLHHK